MRVEKVEAEKSKKVEVGDVLESLDTGIYYLITSTNKDKYGWTSLNRNISQDYSYDTITEAIEATTGNYIVHKSDDIKLVIEK